MKFYEKFSEDISSLAGPFILPNAFWAGKGEVNNWCIATDGFPVIVPIIFGVGVCK